MYCLNFKPFLPYKNTTNLISGVFIVSVNQFYHILQHKFIIPLRKTNVFNLLTGCSTVFFQSFFFSIRFFFRFLTVLSQCTIGCIRCAWLAYFVIFFIRFFLIGFLIRLFFCFIIFFICILFSFFTF